jgi:ankyrin repeat protein
VFPFVHSFGSVSKLGSESNPFIRCVALLNEQVYSTNLVFHYSLVEELNRYTLATNSIDEELIEAAGENNLLEVERLLSVGADIEAKDRYGWTSLYEAISMGHVQVVKVLQEHGADIETKDNDGRTPLHLSCSDGHLAVVNELLIPSDNKGSTTTSILGKRKRQGANVEAKDIYGDTPLHLASFWDQLPVVKALLSAGADIRAANNEGLLPVHYAVNRRNSEVAEYLFQQLYATTRRPPLHKLLQDLTFDGNSPNCSDYPPLRAALDENVLGTDDVVEILEYLVGQNPALLCSRDQDTSLPLHVACRRGASFAIVQSLVNLYKPSVKTVTPQGDLPLFLACEMPETSLDTIFLLIKLYPDLVYHRHL